MNSQKKRYVVSGLSVAYVLFLVYLFLVWGRGPIFQELPISEYAKTYVNVIPFKTTVEQLRNLNAGLINTEIVLANTLGHILAFFPMGALLALAYESCFVFLSSVRTHPVGPAYWQLRCGCHHIQCLRLLCRFVVHKSCYEQYQKKAD